MSVFNNKGEINASSVKDLAQQLVKYASVLEENVPSNQGLVSGVNRSEMDEMIARAMHTEGGKLALAQVMANPIRKNLDYHGVARKALVVDVLEPGEIASYEKDIDVSAVVVASNGSGPESRVFGERVLVPEIELFSNPTVRHAEALRRRFNVINRAVQKARQEIMAAEDANCFAALDAAAQVENQPTDINDAGVLKRDLVAIKRNVDRWDNVTSKFFMNINEYADLLLWGSGGGQGAGGGDFDPVTMREVLQTGLKGSIFGADIIVSKVVPAGTVYGCADPEFVGVMPVRQDIEVYPADEMKQLKLGWVVTEIIGIGILNPRGVAVGRKSVTVQP